MPVGLTHTSPPFNAAHFGTPEPFWDAALKHERALELPNAAIVVVSPHPDDEVLGAGGLIRAAASAGRAVTVLSVTDGEAAYADWQGLDRIRCREVSEALSVLAPLHQMPNPHLRIRDGRVDYYRSALFEAIDRYVSPSTLLVAPYERDGHPDHDATGQVCCEIARLRALTLWRYPIWTWHHSTPQRLAGRPRGRFLLDAAAMQAKARAMNCFTSQMRPSGRQPIVPHHVLRYFRRSYEAFLL
jgi:LmbE family N-acetylglucosaminyl deacetylase